MPARRKDFKLTIHAPEKWDVDQIDPIVWRALAQIYLNGKRRAEKRRQAQIAEAAAREPQEVQPDNLNTPQVE